MVSTSRKWKQIRIQLSHVTHRIVFKFRTENVQKHNIISSDCGSWKGIEKIVLTLICSDENSYDDGQKCPVSLS